LVKMTLVEPGHPRAKSLKIRERLAEGFKAGLVVPEGLAAHGRGEAFDYFLGERTTSHAREAIRAAVAVLLTGESPVISVNGNVAALVPSEVVRLADLTGAKLEVNIYHRSPERERLIAEHLRNHGAKTVLGTEEEYATKIPEIHSDRRKVDKRGIASADVVLVPLEDGDRTEALRKLGKVVIAIDLNPLSRTAQAANITIVDNIVRALPLMIEEAKALAGTPREGLLRIFRRYDNGKILRSSIELMRRRLQELE